MTLINTKRMHFKIWKNIGCEEAHRESKKLRNLVNRKMAIALQKKKSHGKKFSNFSTVKKQWDFIRKK